MAERFKESKPAWLLVDSFVGALSDFADETVVDVFSSRSAAVREVKSRIRILESWHQDCFEPDEITLPSDREIDQELGTADCVKYQSSDVCRYSWKLFNLADKREGRAGMKKKFEKTDEKAIQQNRGAGGRVDARDWRVERDRR